MRSGAVRAIAVDVVGRFALPAAATSVEPHGDGLINHTFLVTAARVRYILQRINDLVFPDPERIMSNLSLLARHFSTCADPGIRLPTLIPARDGRPLVRDEQGGVWRLMEFIRNTRVLNRIDDLDQAREVGRILGRFHVDVGDLPVDRFAVTLPGFHVTPGYLAKFEAILEKGVPDHVGGLTPSIKFVMERRTGIDVLEKARRQRRIPVRVIHGDPKLDNILFDRGTGRAVSLIDLDTVQPGLVHYDVGDCLRSCCGRRGGSAEGGGSFDLDLCRAVLEAYAAETRNLLLSSEIELLVDAIRLIPFELGLRFLTDHLEGDRHFRVTERGQNLVKARAQLALVADIESKEREIRGVVQDCFGEGGPVAANPNAGM